MNDYSNQITTEAYFGTKPEFKEIESKLKVLIEFCNNNDFGKNQAANGIPEIQQIEKLITKAFGYKDMGLFIDEMVLRRIDYNAYTMPNGFKYLDLNQFKKMNFNIQAEFESECRKIKLKREIEEREYRNLQNQNTTDRSFADQLRDRDDELRNLLAEMGRLSKNYNNRIEEMNKLHSDEIGSIHSDYQKKIENLNKEIAELQERIEYISYQAQQVENDMRQEREKEIHLQLEQENLEYNRLFEENKKLRWELEQLRSKDSS